MKLLSRLSVSHLKDQVEIISRSEFTFHPEGSGIIEGDLKVMLKLRRSEPHDSIRDLGVTLGDQDPPGGV